jgi:histidine triad (HIT) family protein
VLDVDPRALAATTSLVQRVSQAMVSELGASGVCVLNASGPNSGRSIDHLHFHIVPRYPEDGEDCLPWPSTRSTHLVEGDPWSLLAGALAPAALRPLGSDAP